MNTTNYRRHRERGPTHQVRDLMPALTGPDGLRTADLIGQLVEVTAASIAVQLTAAANLVPAELGTAAVVAVTGDAPDVHPAGGSPAALLANDKRWWEDTIRGGAPRTPAAFEGFPEPLVEDARRQGFETAWMLPLDDPGGGAAVGCLAVWLHPGDLGTPDHHPTLRVATALAATAICHERELDALRREAGIDPLTGIANRAALNRRLSTVAEQVTAAMLDLDDFKALNDTHGHLVGDEVLRIVAQRLARAVRHTDFVARLDGDEFAVIFGPGLDEDRMTERIADAVSHPIRLGDGLVLSVNVSVGVATASPATVLDQADQAMYRNKRSLAGRPNGRAPCPHPDCPTRAS